MAEKIVSPGVFTKEIDQSFLPAGVQAIGAAVIGPTSKGPALVPTMVSSYSEFVNIFGGKFESGSGDGQVTSVCTASGAESAAGTSFTLTTLSDGADQNSESTLGTNGILPDGTSNNLRWEVNNVNNNKGTFQL